MKKVPFSKHLLVVAVLATAIALSILEACTDKSEKAAIAEGRELFLSYCAICHGENADGKGSMAGLLSTPPLDLRKIAQRRNGQFPEDEIARIIATAERVPGHSLGEMPAWWETFKKAEHIDDPAVVRQKIEHIVAYLKTIQE